MRQQEDIKNSGKTSAEIMIEQKLTEYLGNVLNAKVHHVNFMKRSESCFAVKEAANKVPYLRLFVYEDSYGELIGEPRSMGLVKEDTALRIKEFLRSMFESEDSDLKTRIDMAEFYDKDMYIGVGSWEKICYMEYVYKHTDEVRECVIETTGAIPKNVYAASTPGINIVFETKEYRRHRIRRSEDKLIANIRLLADRYVQDKYKCPIEGMLKVKIWTPDTEGYSAYGLARQD